MHDQVHAVFGNLNKVLPCVRGHTVAVVGNTKLQGLLIHCLLLFREAGKQALDCP